MENRTKPYAKTAWFDGRTHHIVISLDTGNEIAFDPTLVEALAGAREADLAEVRVEGVGSTLHFPSLDVDVTIAGLIQRLSLSEAVK